MAWKLTYLGGYELMRDGTQTIKGKTHIELLKELHSNEVFYEFSNNDFLELINEFVSDKDAFDFIENVWKERHNDGGGWGQFDCKDITGLLQALRAYDFNLE